MFNALTYILIIILLTVCLVIFSVTVQYIYTFHFHKCKHCGGTMEYKGLKENKTESHYLFHCDHCGAWEEVPKNEMFLNYDSK